MSSTNFGSILILASCVVVYVCVCFDCGAEFESMGFALAFYTVNQVKAPFKDPFP